MAQKHILLAVGNDNTARYLDGYDSDDLLQAQTYADDYFLSFPENPQDIPLKIMILTADDIRFPAS